MFDIGWTELLVIGVVALIVIGPKDLPDMFRTMGRFTAKARSMARDFQRAMESAADDAGVKDIANDLKTVTSARSMGLDKVKEAATKFEKWDPLKPALKPAVPPTAAAQSAEAAAPATPAGPATQALIDQKAEQRARHAAAVSALTKPAAPSPAAPGADGSGATEPTTKPAPKPRAKPKDPIEKAIAAAKPGGEPAAKPAPKPRAKKTDGKKAET
jgi:sec-independent protein translocase protein TatB